MVHALRSWSAMAVLAVMALVAAPAASFGAEAKAELGKPAPDFELKTVNGDKTVKLSDFKGEKVVVITFQSIECPWNWYREGAGYEAVLYPLAKEYEAKGVQFISINSNATESIEAISSYIEKSQTPYPIVKDPGNKVADLYEGKTTPHFFIVDKEGILRYRGGFEKAPRSPETCGKSDEQYLVPAIEAVLNGSEVAKNDTTPKGCTIKRG